MVSGVDPDHPCPAHAQLSTATLLATSGQAACPALPQPRTISKWCCFRNISEAPRSALVASKAPKDGLASPQQTPGLPISPFPIPHRPFPRPVVPPPPFRLYVSPGPTQDHGHLVMIAAGHE